MHKIAKDFNFCFGHRVWSQVLDADFADNLQCACRHLHGHEAKVTVHLSASSLTRGMVTDFRHLEWLKKFLDTVVDHKFVIDSSDPLFTKLTEGLLLEEVCVKGIKVGHSLVVPSHVVGAELEYLQSFLVVDFVPTSENFSEWLFNIVERAMGPLQVEVDAVEWWESPKSRSIFSKRVNNEN
jgi:6-pyruvoyltetrahydropterin/6-carboxytetrahydropterin synthase